MDEKTVLFYSLKGRGKARSYVFCNMITVKDIFCNSNKIKIK